MLLVSGSNVQLPLLWLMSLALDFLLHVIRRDCARNSVQATATVQLTYAICTDPALPSFKYVA
jgi:hypothetical protein